MCVCLPQLPWMFIFSSRGRDRQSSEQNNRKSISPHNAMARTINMHVDLQISSCWERISTWNMHGYHRIPNWICRGNFCLPKTGVILLKTLCILLHHSIYTYTDLSIRGGTRYFDYLEWSLVPPEFKVLHKIFIKIVQILIKSTACK